ncbi:MAG: DNA repair protein RadA [Chlamydiae bacterium]|nr:DNA repair protein RadA [Chlamydiota bacterium]
MKVKTLFACTSCGAQFHKWCGQCALCNEWNTVEEQFPAVPKQQASTPLPISQVEIKEDVRFSSGFEDVDRVLGGGFVQGSFVLVGGEPGIGKSTLLLQIAHHLALSGKTVLYVSGEESVSQISLRAKRLGALSDNLLIFNEIQYETICYQIETIKPNLVIIDSIQVLQCQNALSSPGSVAQVRELASKFMQLSKSLNITHIIIGHVTKSGEIAGPRMLEHLVDCVLYFEGETKQQYRFLRGVKNRFGSIHELAVFEMKTKGLEEVKNPSSLCIQHRGTNSGACISCVVEGSRAVLLEIQALVAPTHFPSPMRKTQGFDHNRLSLLLAVMEKKLGLRLFTYDIFVSIAGGLKVQDPALDLSVCMAILSSLKNKRIDPLTLVIGEVGLSNEIRAVDNVEKRLKEAKNLGFQKVILPKQKVDESFKQSLELISLERLDTIVSTFFH